MRPKIKHHKSTNLRNKSPFILGLRSSVHTWMTKRLIILSLFSIFFTLFVFILPPSTSHFIPPLRCIILQKWIILKNYIILQRPHYGSYHELDIDGASSRPQLAGREVAFYTIGVIPSSTQIIQSSGHRGVLQITRGCNTPMVILFYKLVIYTWGSLKFLGRFAGLRPSVSSL